MRDAWVRQAGIHRSGSGTMTQTGAKTSPGEAQTAVLVLALLAIELLAGRHLRATLRCSLWLLVVAKLLLPPSLSLSTGFAYWLGPWLFAPVVLNEPNPPGELAFISTVEMNCVWGRFQVPGHPFGTRTPSWLHQHDSGGRFLRSSYSLVRFGPARLLCPSATGGRECCG